MKTKILYFLLLLSGIASAQIVNIPDADFKDYLLFAAPTNNIAKDINGLSITIDTNGDDEIQENEALAVYQLKIDNSIIVDLTGIAYFTNLTSLNCRGGDIITLDVSMLNSLVTLDCSENELTSLNIAGLANLQNLYCADNNLTTLDLSGCPSIKYLSCPTNQLTSLNMSDIEDIILLEFSDNQIASIDVTQFPSLTSIYALNNLLETIDVTNQPLLENLYLEGNQLTSIFMKNGSNELEGETSLENNPNLAYICVDEEEMQALIDLLPDMGLSTDDVNVNSYCSFTPGGDYNTITGALTFDFNSNGCDPGDVPHPFIKININDGINSGATFSNSEGTYDFFTQAGSFTVTPEFENDWFTVSPPSAIVDFPVVDNSVDTQNFCITPNGVHSDLEVVMVPVIPARPGFNAVYKIVYKNKGNQILSGGVTCQWDYNVLDEVNFTPNPNEYGPGIYTWNYANLLPFENREILMTLAVNSPGDTPAVNNGDVLTFTAFSVIGTDENPADNNFVLDQEVVGSFDPNNIICIEGENAPPATIGDFLHYVVNFENTGTAAAEFVVVAHNIDAAQFDISSLQVLNSSHEARVRVTGSRVEFIFSGINLAPLDHGNILFKLKSSNALKAGDNVMNRANIFFDYNFPIETNEANTVFQVLSSGDFETDDSVKVYPNPSKGIVNISADSNVKSIQLYDIQGRLLQTVIVNETVTVIDISSKQAGIYFLKITTDKGAKVEKVIRE